MNGVSVVIPAFNEESSIQLVVTELRDLLIEHNITSEIIVIDDGSTDATAQRANAAHARVLQHRSNRGYGASLKTGIVAASYDVIAITDADGTYPGRYLPQLLTELESADMVVGARIGNDVHIPLVRRPAKWVLKRLANYVSNSTIPDLNSGLRVFRRDLAMQYFPILPNYFSFTTTITLATLCDNYAVTYVPIDYRKRQGRSKIVPWDSGSFAILILRVAMLFRPLRVFLPLALICLLYGVVKTAIDLSHDPNISASAMFALMSTLLIVLIGMLGDSIATRLGKLNPNAVIGVRTREIVELEPEPATDGAIEPVVYSLAENIVSSRFGS
ncbi:MAG: glycosyltransferase family 2 protein [Acidobacteria bacterium]|nr:glycosyltransferase family 2 protein [Acidobacteriota bacterium]